MVIAVVIAISFSSPSLSPAVTIPGALVVLWSGLVWLGLCPRRRFVVVCILTPPSTLQAVAIAAVAVGAGLC